MAGRSPGPAAVFVALLGVLGTGRAAAQTAQSDTVLLDRPVRVFLDCQTEDCGFDRLRADILFVEWVREPAAADVHVLVTSGRSSLGTVYQLDFIGRNAFQDLTWRLTSEAPSWYIEEERLSAITQRTRQGLLPFAARSVTWTGLDVVYQPGSTAGAPPSADPWKRWVFTFYTDGSYHSERQTDAVYLSGSFSINRTTERMKLDLTLFGSRSEDRFDLSEGTLTSTAEDYRAAMLFVGSLGRRAALGVQPTVWSSTYENLELGVRLAPAFELNLFPYSETTRRRLVLRYTVGPNDYRFVEETLDGRMTERFWDHKVLLALDLVQPWGSIGGSVAASHYMHDRSKYRTEMDVQIDLRVVRGVILQFGGSYDVVRDQIFLPKAGATEEEVLLRRRQLATEYKASLWAGFGFRFGSAFNSIVNSRLQ